jgi:uncharacterized protein with HEPN domain
MSRHDDATRLQQMLDYAREAMQMARGRQRTHLASDRMFELAMTRLLEIIGEAASKVSPDLRARFRDIEWGPIIGLRNRLIHGYDSIDHDILWQIVAGDLPTLVGRLERRVEDLDDDSPPLST